MRGKLVFLAGAATGFVLGTRAGREKYDELVGAAKRLMDSPTVHEAGGVVQAQAAKLYGQGKETLSNSKLADRVLHRTDGPKVIDDTTPQHMSPNSF